MVVSIIECYTVGSVEMEWTYLIPVKNVIYAVGRCPTGLKFYIKKKKDTQLFNFSFHKAKSLSSFIFLPLFCNNIGYCKHLHSYWSPHAVSLIAVLTVSVEVHPDSRPTSYSQYRRQAPPCEANPVHTAVIQTEHSTSWVQPLQMLYQCYVDITINVKGITCTV